VDDIDAHQPSAHQPFSSVLTNPSQTSANNSYSPSSSSQGHTTTAAGPTLGGPFTLFMGLALGGLTVLSFNNGVASRMASLGTYGVWRDAMGLSRHHAAASVRSLVFLFVFLVVLSVIGKSLFRNR
jgi:hypothetical protein